MTTFSTEWFFVGRESIFCQRFKFCTKASQTQGDTKITERQRVLTGSVRSPSAPSGFWFGFHHSYAYYCVFFGGGSRAFSHCLILFSIVSELTCVFCSSVDCLDVDSAHTHTHTETRTHNKRETYRIIQLKKYVRKIISFAKSRNEANASNNFSRVCSFCVSLPRRSCAY